MAFKRYRRFRRSRRRRSFRRGYMQKNSAMGFGSRGHWKRARIPGNIVLGSAEMKFMITTTGAKDTLQNIQNAGTPYIINPFTLIAQGTGPSQRIGRKINAHALNIRMAIRCQPAAQDFVTDLPTTMAAAMEELSSSVRLMVVLDRQCNGVGVTAVNDFLDAGSLLAFNSLYKKGRFKTLYDKILTFNQRLNAVFNSSGITQYFFGDCQTKNIQIYLNLKGLPIEYNSTAGALSEMQTNNIFIILWSDYSVDAATSHGFYSICKVRYLDP